MEKYAPKTLSLPNLFKGFEVQLSCSKKQVLPCFFPYIRIFFPPFYSMKCTERRVVIIIFNPFLRGIFDNILKGYQKCVSSSVVVISDNTMFDFRIMYNLLTKVYFSFFHHNRTRVLRT